MLGLRMSHAQTQRQEQRQALTHDQRLQLQASQLQLRQELVEAIHGKKFEPRAICKNPSCGHTLTKLEIMQGFRDDPTDYTTECPKCKTRFHPILRSGDITSAVELPFYCRMQTLDQLPKLREVPLELLKKNNPAVYNSAVYHFGGLKNAFKEINLVYAFEADLDWKKHVGTFLGKLPDTVVAKLVGASPRTVRNLRIERGIPRYSKRNDPAL